MSPQLRTALRDSGVSRAELEQIAGRDHVIRGQAELENLFARIDRLDSNGSSDSFTARDHAGSLTRAGTLYEAFRAQTDSARADAARNGGRRFAGDATLTAVADGNATLRQGASGASVRTVQQALIDSGFGIPGGASGTFDSDTKAAVQRFQREVGLGADGVLGSDTLGALAATAPPPGQVLERRPEYGRMFSDGRLDVTIAVGFDEHGTVPATERNILSGLRAQGYLRIDPSAMTPSQRADLGLTSDRFDPNAAYFHRTFTDPQTGNDVDSVVRLITPGSDGARARASFEQAMEQDEVVIYAGHARYGTGPDFDHMDQGAGNFVVDGHGNRRGHRPPAGLRASIGNDPRRSDLGAVSQRPDYQLLVMNACTTEDYLHNLRGPGFPGRDERNTDIISTTMPSRLATNGQHAVGFLASITSRESSNQMIARQNGVEQQQLRAFGMDDLVPRAGNLYSESGFLQNSENRTRAP